jgi:sulfonate transport system substrate-binding protein
MKSWFGRAAALITVGMGLALSTAAAEAKDLRIGYQKYGSLVLLKERGAVEKRLSSEGYNVTWTEFPGGPQLLEALNAGAIDFGTTGEAPPIFAQAAGAPLLYVGVEPPAPEGEAILVPKDSKITKVTQLKGKKVALNKGSNVHYLLARALEAEHLTLKDVEAVYLPPADARAAFESGAVDAWVIWDPFLAAAQAATGARTLVDGKSLVSNHQFYLSSQSFAESAPATLKVLLEEIAAVDKWAASNPDEVAKTIAPRIGIPEPVLTVALKRAGYGVQPVSDEVAAEQQRIADTFHGAGLLPKPIVVRDVIWRAPS